MHQLPPRPAELALACLLADKPEEAANFLRNLVGSDGVVTARQLAKEPAKLKAPEPPRREAYKKSSQLPRIIITLTPEEFHHVHDLAFRASTSVSWLAQLALVRLINDAETGKIALLPEFYGDIDPGHA